MFYQFCSLSFVWPVTGHESLNIALLNDIVLVLLVFFFRIPVFLVGVSYSRHSLALWPMSMAKNYKICWKLIHYPEPASLPVPIFYMTICTDERWTNSIGTDSGTRNSIGTDSGTRWNTNTIVCNLWRILYRRIPCWFLMVNVNWVFRVYNYRV